MRRVRVARPPAFLRACCSSSRAWSAVPSGNGSFVRGHPAGRVHARFRHWQIVLFVRWQDFYFSSAEHAGWHPHGAFVPVFCSSTARSRCSPADALCHVAAVFGVMRVVSSVELRALSMRRWGWVALLGVVLLVAGLLVSWIRGWARGRWARRWASASSSRAGFHPQRLAHGPLSDALPRRTFAPQERENSIGLLKALTDPPATRTYASTLGDAALIADRRRDRAARRAPRADGSK